MAAILIFLLGLLAVAGCDQNPAQPPPKKPLVPITFATTRFIGEAPTYVAYDKGFFRDEGLDVTLQNNIMGWQSLRDLFLGGADIATVAELPIVYSAFDKKKYTEQERGEFVIFGELVLSNQGSQQILARRDRGINQPTDIRGKTVALPFGTTVDFFFDALLTHYQIDRSELNIVNMDVVSQVDAIVRGDVDVIIGWQPHIRDAQLKLGDVANLLELDLYYHTAWVLTAMKDWASRQPEVLDAVLRALVKAKRFIDEHPDEAIAIHSRYAEVDPRITAALWEDVSFDIFLSEGLLTTMEDQARWIMRKGGAAGQPMPDFRTFLDMKPIQRVRPEGLTIIQ